MRIRIPILFSLFFIITVTGCSSGTDQLLTTETYDLPTSVSGIVFDAIGQASVQIGETNSLTIIAEPSILRGISYQVNNQVLTLSETEEVLTAALDPALTTQFIITVKQLQQISFSGRGTFTVNDARGTTLTMRQTGVGKITLSNIDYVKIDLYLDGGGQVQVSGSAKEQNLTITGAIQYHGSDLSVNRVTADLSGNSSAIVWVEDYLSLKIRDSAHLSYYGFPEVVNINNPDQVEYMGLR